MAGAAGLLEDEEVDETLCREEEAGDRGLGEGVIGVGAERVEAHSKAVSQPMPNKWRRANFRAGL